MDISALTNASASGFTGFGGTASLPAGVQAKLMSQSQSLNLLPPVSGPGLGSVLDIYDAVDKQALGALSGRSSVELANLSLGNLGDGKASGAQATGNGEADGPGAAPPALGKTLDQILDEDGFVPQDNPYSVQKDFFADRGSLGGLLDSLG